jgi:hypothetical protein
MRFTARALGLALTAFISCGTAGARLILAPGFPWTYSVTGSETVTSLAVDFRGWVWTAGNAYKAATGRDLLVLTWTMTHSGGPYVARTIDGTAEFSSVFGWATTDEGEPKVATWDWRYGGESKEYVFIACTESAGGKSYSGAWNIFNYYQSTSGSLFMSSSILPSTAAALAVGGSGTPFVTGTITSGGVKQLLYYRILPDRGNISAGNYSYAGVVSATWWTGSALSIEGRGIALEGGSAWIVGASQGDLYLFRYTEETFQEQSTNEVRARPDPAFDPPKNFPTAAWDEPRAMKRDAVGNLMVAGSSDGSAALWKIGPDGTLSWMVKPLGNASSTLYALDFDARGGCVAVGAAGADMVLLVVGSDGRLTEDAVIATAAPDAVAATGVHFNHNDGSVWVGATVSSAPSSPVWRGTCARLYYFTPDSGPSLVAQGGVQLRVTAGSVVKGPGGVLNARAGERISVLARAADGGTVRASLMTMRGEVIREFSEELHTGGVAEFLWDGRNSAGEEAAPGAYLLRVTGGGIQAVKRIVVIRNR